MFFCECKLVELECFAIVRYLYLSCAMCNCANVRVLCETFFYLDHCVKIGTAKGPRAKFDKLKSAKF